MTDQPEKRIELPRYGIKWQAEQMPACVPVVDGYWTPWHLAEGLRARNAALESDLAAVTASSVEHAKTIDGLRAELARARLNAERYEYNAALAERDARIEALEVGLRCVGRDISYALTRASTNGDGSMDNLSATRLIKADRDIRALLKGGE